MKERPILFSPPMVRAILDGTKSQTRRVLKNPENYGCPTGDCPHETQAECGVAMQALCPYGVPGDRLWVKEKHVLLDRDGWIDPTRDRAELFPTNPYPRRNGVGYTDFTHDADSERCRKELGYTWRPSIHMPRWASRITLEIVLVRAERVRDLTVRDAICEGIGHDASEDELARIMESDPYFDIGDDRHKETFADLWDSINAKRGFGWDVNPWVWCLEFRRIIP